MEKNNSKKAQSDMQVKVENLYKIIDLDIHNGTYKNFVILDKDSHCEFSLGGLLRLPRGVTSLCSGQPWLMYWNLNSLNIMKMPIPEEITSQVIALLSECKCSDTGAFCGGPSQDPHLAPTYASVAALISLNSPKGYSIIDRKGIHDFIVSMKHKTVPGAFTMHTNGESDMRSVYCAICVASVLNILDDAVAQDVANHIANCQNYDGGFSAEPFGESHGGYTFCAVASLIMLEKTSLADCERALEWCLMRQMDLEGGFNGRPNKLVDSCYTFWIGAAIVMLKDVLNIPQEVQICTPEALQAYVMVACQSPMGLFDKPGSSPDYYHTAYSLGGLSFFQEPKMFKESILDLAEVDPLVNALKKNVQDARKYFIEQGPI